MYFDGLFECVGAYPVGELIARQRRDTFGANEETQSDIGKIKVCGVDSHSIQMSPLDVGARADNGAEDPLPLLLDLGFVLFTKMLIRVVGRGNDSGSST